jgi:hypothetical protein
LSRRQAGKLLVALPAAALAAQSPPEKPSPTAEFIAAGAAGFSPEERERLKRKVSELEKALAAIRDFKLPADVSPSLRFQPLRSKRS